MSEEVVRLLTTFQEKHLEKHSVEVPKLSSDKILFFQKTLKNDVTFEMWK